MTNLRNPLLGLAALAFFVSTAACTSSTPAGPNEYEDCSSGEACPDDTDCMSTGIASGEGSGLMCTHSCGVPGDCPADPNGATVDCVILGGMSGGQCYIDCSASEADCKDSTICADLGGASICVP